ncbi:hypothetical protein PN465_07620 [Nodularia spumigena CS-584]|jgi:hypothetical protein|uniref:hypothetical protein n=1 Tax=Nodularia spumigena TaxID=70799 RepID=UPI0000EAB8A7|nr:hypothetical protein [Nodularia spumigena]AHJ26429.1 hypothetical protein NSP_720 [Nodularia spumigena CCY9414]EAW47164.1 hypothetical protein N9414_04905 [Nodularia spumigena CCY9414]MDB9382091.1 hypothetical protein [Nodularia spumigena CS-584]
MMKSGKAAERTVVDQVNRLAQEKNSGLTQQLPKILIYLTAFAQRMPARAVERQENVNYA